MARHRTPLHTWLDAHVSGVETVLGNHHTSLGGRYRLGFTSRFFMVLRHCEVEYVPECVEWKRVV